MTERDITDIVDGNPDIGRAPRIPPTRRIIPVADSVPIAGDSNYEALGRTSTRKRLGLGALLVGAGLALFYALAPVVKETDYYKVNMAPVAKIEARAGTSIEDLARKEGIIKGEDPRYHRYAVKMLRMNNVYVGPNEMKRIGNDGLVSLDSTGVYALDVDRDGDYSGKQPIRE